MKRKKKKVTIRGELAKAGGGLLSEFVNQIIGPPISVKKKRKRGGNTIHIHYHFNKKKGAS